VIANVMKAPQGIQPYRSSDENGFLRGGALQIRWGIANLAAFVSRKSINARVDSDGNLTSFDLSGLSRNVRERQTRAASGESIVGVQGTLRASPEFRMGLRAYSATFDNQLMLHGLSSLQGRQFWLTSADLAYVSETAGSFAEYAVDQAKSTAAIAGMILQPVPRLNVALVAHSYGARFTNLHGFGFGESGNVQNERGVYASARVSIFERLAFSTYFDQFESIASNTVSLLPTHGNEYLGALQLICSDRSTIQAELKHKNQANAETVLDEFSRSEGVVGIRTQTNYRITFEWNPTTFFEWKSRYERVRVQYSVDGPAANGMLLYQDFRWRLFRQFSVDCRLVSFDTDSYDSRLYEYESELHGTFSNPALFGKGIHTYLLARYETDWFELSAKFSSTVKPGSKWMGTGANEIAGDTDNQISFQIDVGV